MGLAGCVPLKGENVLCWNAGEVKSQQQRASFIQASGRVWNRVVMSRNDGGVRIVTG